MTLTSDLSWKLEFQDLQSSQQHAESRLKLFWNKYGGITQEFEKFSEKLQSEITCSFNELKEVLFRLRDQKNALKWEIMLVKSGKPEDELKIFFKEIGETVENLKVEQTTALEQLAKEEIQLQKQVSALHKSYQEWNKKSFPRQTFKRSTSAVMKSKNLPREILEFQDFMYSTRKHQEDWTDCEHKIFTKIWRQKQSESDDNIVQAIEIELPSKYAEEIQSHINWYRQYLIKNEKKLFVLNQWKQQKEQKNMEKLRSSKELLEGDLEKERKSQILQERNEKAQQILAWKQAKQEITKATEEEQIARQTKLIRKQKAQEKRMKRLKLVVNEYQERKKALEELEKVEKQAKEKREQHRAVQLSKNIGKLWERDKMIVNERREKVLQLTKIKIPQRRINYKVQKDNTRIFKLTKSWQAKLQAKENSKLEPKHFLPPITSIPHKKIPQWLTAFQTTTDS